jgi:hypothetical protein
MQKIIFLFFFIGIINCQAQTFDLNISVKNISNSEVVEYANIFIQPCSCGGTTDEKGSFSIPLLAATYQVITSYIGFQNDTTTIVLNKNSSTEIFLKQEGYLLDKVIITANDTRENIERTVMGVQQLSMDKMKLLPTALGEVDVLSSLSMLAGVGSAGEASNGLSVRGGSLDQNLVLLDYAPIFNPTHLFGLFSIFTPEAIGEVELFRSNMPSKYGGRISSVVDVKVKNPTADKFTLTGGVGVASTRLAIETPIIKNKLSVLASTRVFYNDFLFSLNKRLKNTKANFVDGTIKLRYLANDKNSFFLTGFVSHDFYQLDIISQINSITSSSNQYDYSTLNGTLNWVHIMKDDASLRTTLVSSNYAPKIFFPQENSDKVINFESKIQTQSLQSEYSKIFNSNWNYSGGLQVQRTSVSPGNLIPDGITGLEKVELPQENSFELSAYSNVDWTPSEKISISVGLRYTQFLLLGAFEEAQYDNEERENITSIISYDQGDLVKTYQGLEPRFGARYKVSKNTSLKASYSLTRQYLQNIYNSTTPLPTSRWKTSDAYIAPQVGQTYSLGFYQNIKDNKIAFSIEGYYRSISNVLDYKPGADFFLQQFIEKEVVQGKGKTYGVEFSLEQTKGKVQGWFNYTWAKSQRKFYAEDPGNRVNNNNWFNSDFDRPHVFNSTINFKLNKYNTYSFNFTYQTGKPYSIPNAIFNANNVSVPIYLERNNARLPAYHRLDFTWRIHNINTKEERRFKGDWIFTVYNLYARKNAFNRYFNGNVGATKINQLAIFNSALLSLTYSFRFE